jgi:hypothetical protein
MAKAKLPYNLEPRDGDPDPEKTKKLSMISAGLTVATGILWAAWDIVPAMWEGRNDTISENIRNWSRYNWTLPLFWGALSSHFFINAGQAENYQIRFYIFAGVILTCIGANLGTYFGAEWEVPVWARSAFFFGGLVLGLVLWSQDA